MQVTPECLRSSLSLFLLLCEFLALLFRGWSGLQGGNHVGSDRGSHLGEVLA